MGTTATGKRAWGRTEKRPEASAEVGLRAFRVQLGIQTLECGVASLDWIPDSDDSQTPATPRRGMAISKNEPR